MTKEDLPRGGACLNGYNAICLLSTAERWSSTLAVLPRAVQSSAVYASTDTQLGLRRPFPGNNLSQIHHANLDACDAESRGGILIFNSWHGITDLLQGSINCGIAW